MNRKRVIGTKEQVGINLMSEKFSSSVRKNPILMLGSIIEKMAKSHWDSDVKQGEVTIINEIKI